VKSFRINKLWHVAVAAALAMSAPLGAVDYGGEKSFLFEIPYKVCLVAPLPEEAKKAGIVPITTKEARRYFDEGAHFYDARRSSHFQEGRIQGSKEVLFDSSKAHYTVIDLPKSKEEKLVFYCYGEDCANSYEAALAVKQQGYKHVYWYSHGFSAWHAAGHPIEGKRKKAKQ